jgi:hypothetical protein
MRNWGIKITERRIKEAAYNDEVYSGFLIRVDFLFITQLNGSGRGSVKAIY